MAESTATTGLSLHENKSHWENVCKIGQGAHCCKYLVMGTSGFECMRDKPENKKVIDDNWDKVPHVAQGDNCIGYETSKKPLKGIEPLQLVEDPDWALNVSKLEQVAVNRNQNDKRYEEPFEDDGAYADECED